MLLPARTFSRLFTYLALLCLILISLCFYFTDLTYPLRTLSPISLHGSKEEPEITAVDHEVNFSVCCKSGMTLTHGQTVVSDSVKNRTAIPSTASNSSRIDFIEYSSQVEIPSFDPLPIQTMCSTAPWPKDLVFECIGASGGLNNVKQQVLTCVRWAIEFKAALVLPTIRPRVESKSSDNVVHEYAAPIDIDVLFDRERFVQRLRDGCPQMRIYENTSAIAHPKMIKKVRSVDLTASATSEEIAVFKANWTRDNPSAINTIRLATLPRNANLL
jgi:hypothetical protein